MKILRLGRRAMGSSFELLLCGEDEARLRLAAEEAFDEIDRLEAQMSLYLDGSELSQINELAFREEVLVEPGLFQLLRRAETLHRETWGAFDITVKSGMRHVRFGDRSLRFLREDVALDLGGIGKGYAIERAAEILRTRGITSAFLHGGSSTIYALGAPPGEAGWRVGLVDPRDSSRRLGSVLLKDQALSTSSPFGKAILTNGEFAGHVIDPRNGKSVESACAWAISPSATDSDALAKAFLILGPEGITRFREKHPETSGAFLGEEFSSYGVRIEPAPIIEITATVPSIARRDFLKGAAAAVAAFSVGSSVASARTQDSSPSQKLQIAVIGLGEQGKLLLSHLARMKKVQVRAVCDVEDEKIKKALEVAGRNVESYEDFKQLLDTENLDAVAIATPTHLHAPVALYALSKGVSVFCEAPLAHTVEDCKKIVAAAKESKKTFQVGHQRRSSKLYPHALTHIKSGAIGKILQVRAQWNRKQSWRRMAKGGAEWEKTNNWRLYKESSGGLLLEYGSHIFDLANWYLGATPVSAVGTASLQQWKDGRDVEDSAQVILQYPEGVQLHFQASLVNSYGGENELIIGDAACILLMQQKKGLLFKEADTVAAGWEQYAKKEMLGDARGIILDADATKYASHDKPESIGPEADKADYFAELEQFIDCVRDGTPPKCGAKTGLKAAVTAILANEAATKQTVVRFSKEQFEG